MINGPVMTTLLSPKFTEAVEYARVLHTEARKGTHVPYMAHLLGVAALVLGENGYVSFPVTDDIAVAALLHDAAEDKGGEERLCDIERHFGRDVERIVRGCSDSLLAEGEAKADWKVRKQQYLTRLAQEELDVQLVSAADKLYNARAILDDYRVVGDDLWARFKRGRDDQLWYFEAVIKVFRTAGTNRIVEELSRTIDSLKRCSSATVRTVAPAKARTRS